MQIDLNKLTAKQFKMLQRSGLLAQALKHNPGADVPAAQALHGPGGLFSEANGARGGMYSAVIQPRTFLADLPIMMSEYENEVIEIFTYMSAGTTENPADFCGDPVTPGDLYKCAINRRFGKLFVGTRKVQVPEVGKLNNRAEQERRLLNYANSANPLVPELLRAPNVNFRSAAAVALMELGIMVSRALAPVTIDGDNSLSNTNTEPGWIREFDGLSKLISGTINDTDGNPCPAAASLVITWEAAVDGTVNDVNLVTVVHDAFYSRAQLAEDTGFTGVQWEFVGSKRMFRQLVFIWACTYASARCGDGTAGTPISREMAVIEQRTNEMMRGQYLLIDGQPIPYRFTAETEVSQDGSDFTSDLFLVPISWDGGPLTYVEAFPMDNANIGEWNAIANTTGRTVTNGGMYMMAVRSDGFCDQLLLASQLRLMLDVPFLAARIDGITFPTYAGFRDWDPANTTYFYTGGVSEYTA